MNTMRSALFITTLPGVLLIMAACNTAGAQETSAGETAADHNTAVQITEWPVPWAASRPRDPYLAPDGQVWFVGQSDDYAARFNPATQEFKRYELPEGTGPHNLIVNSDGMVWYAGNRNAHIGRLNPDNGNVQRFPTPEPATKDPHTLIFAGDGNLWFTAQWGNHVGHFNPATGQVQPIPVPTDRARPYGIVRDADGRPWIALLGTNKLATVNPANLALREIELPRENARPRRVAVTDDGTVWYVDYQEGYLGQYHPKNEQFREWRAPGEDRSGPYAMAADARSRLWFVETWQSPNRLVGFDPDSETFFSQTAIPSGGGAVRHMYYDAASNSLWFGTDTNNLARAVLPD